MEKILKQTNSCMKGLWPSVFDQGLLPLLVILCKWMTNSIINNFLDMFPECSRAVISKVGSGVLRGRAGGLCLYTCEDRALDTGFLCISINIQCLNSILTYTGKKKSEFGLRPFKFNLLCVSLDYF